MVQRLMKQQQLSNSQGASNIMNNDSLVKLLLDMNANISETKATLTSVQDQVDSLSEQFSEVNKNLNRHLDDTDNAVINADQKAQHALDKLAEQKRHANLNFNVLVGILIPVLIAVAPLLFQHLHFY